MQRFSSLLLSVLCIGAFSELLANPLVYKPTFHEKFVGYGINSDGHTKNPNIQFTCNSYHDCKSKLHQLLIFSDNTNISQVCFRPEPINSNCYLMYNEMKERYTNLYYFGFGKNNSNEIMHDTFTGSFSFGKVFNTQCDHFNNNFAVTEWCIYIVDIYVSAHILL